MIAAPRGLKSKGAKYTKVQTRNVGPDGRISQVRRKTQGDISIGGDTVSFRSGTDTGGTGMVMKRAVR